MRNRKDILNDIQSEERRLKNPRMLTFEEDATIRTNLDKLYEELAEHDVAHQQAQNMLDYPEDYELV